MRGEAPIEVDLAAKDDTFAVSPFLQPTRGIAFEVISEDGQLVAPAEPMAGSPPPPPLETKELPAILLTSPYRVLTHESARTIFPGAGRYKVRARIFLFNYPSKPVRYAQAVSDTITVNVTK
jgi:hypothetical protein